jgi:RNA polymerase sigma-70 factor (ECF subfamily)
VTVLDPTAEADRYRPELLAHCYRLLGSRHDAEDVVQETFVRAWRGRDRFEGRSSLRRWLYTIATRACLTAMDQRARRALPSTATDGDVWLEPLVDPADVVAARSGVRLAFVAALQHLPAKQRAALVLCDVLAWPAAEVAEMLDLSTAAVTSALQRARAHLERLNLDQDDVAEPDDTGVLDRYAAAFQNADLAALTALLRADVTLEMPPEPEWYAGIEAVTAFIGANVLRRSWGMAATRANGQPAFEAYDGEELHGLHVLTVSGGLVKRIVFFRR